jgi:DNA-binding MarR family transcriptional regulator/GNAT superfamily N-acetyltransferase
MDTEAIARVRSFNRTVTERVGALDDQYLGFTRGLGAARVLWEIGHDGIEVRELRRRLGLDSGYTSRLLRSLEGGGLIVVAATAEDRRVRRAALTAAGRAERERLDRRSDELAASLLEPLDERQRARLQAAMADVERLLQASLIEFSVEDPGTPDARFCIGQYFAEIGERFDAGFDPRQSSSPDVGEFTPPDGLFLVARLRERPVGCGALRFKPGQPADLKRMWIARDVRGCGLGRRTLRELEQRAAEHGATAVRLETNRNLPEAVGLYRSSGYDEVEPFNDERYAHHWFLKQLAPVAAPA